MATAAFASSLVWMRPMFRKSPSSRLCTPSDSRLTPAARQLSKFSRVSVPGLPSIVISASAASAKQPRSVSSIRPICAPVISVGVPPPKNTVSTRRAPKKAACSRISRQTASVYASR